MKNITAHELKHMLDKSKNIMLLNVLPEASYHDCHIEGSVNINYKIDIEDSMHNIDKDQLIVAYCASYSCNASSNAARKLEELGFTNVYIYEGGMKEWRELGLPCSGPCQKEYLYD